MIHNRTILHHWARPGSELPAPRALHRGAKQTVPKWLACWAALCLGQNAGAADWAGFVAASSDNVYHGLTQNQGDAALTGDVHGRTAAGWFAGLAIATVNLNPGPGAPLEIAAYAGRSGPLSASTSGRLSVAHYAYPHDQSSLRYTYDELLASLLWRDRLAANVSYSPNTSRFSFRAINARRPAWSAEVVLRQPVKPQWNLHAGLGHYSMSAPIDQGYWYWNLTLAHSRGAWQFELAAIGTDSEARQLFGTQIAGQRLVFSVIRRFAKMD